MITFLINYDTGEIQMCLFRICVHPHGCLDAEKKCCMDEKYLCPNQQICTLTKRVVYQNNGIITREDKG